MNIASPLSGWVASASKPRSDTGTGVDRDIETNRITLVPYLVLLIVSPYLPSRQLFRTKPHGVYLAREQFFTSFGVPQQI